MCLKKINNGVAPYIGNLSQMNLKSADILTFFPFYIFCALFLLTKIVCNKCISCPVSAYQFFICLVIWHTMVSNKYWNDSHSHIRINARFSENNNGWCNLHLLYLIVIFCFFPQMLRITAHLLFVSICTIFSKYVFIICVLHYLYTPNQYITPITFILF